MLCTSASNLPWGLAPPQRDIHFSPHIPDDQSIMVWAHRTVPATAGNLPTLLGGGRGGDYSHSSRPFQQDQYHCTAFGTDTYTSRQLLPRFWNASLVLSLARLLCRICDDLPYLPALSDNPSCAALVVRAFQVFHNMNSHSHIWHHPVESTRTLSASSQTPRDGSGKLRLRMARDHAT